MTATVVTFLVLFIMAYGAAASDPDMLQDVCVADPASGITVNGFTCKPVANATAADFFFSGLANPGNTNNIQGSLGATANVQEVPGLNTLGLSLGRIDFAPGGLNPPHTHPRATEIIFVLEGMLEVGFVTTANVLISKTIMKGDIFVIPQGLVHFQKNNGDVPAAAFVAFNSQLPGRQTIAVSLFAANPPVPDNVLAMAFQISAKEVQQIKSTKLVP